MEASSASNIIIKYENKSNRVKGLSFHPVRPWILIALHNGQICLWDYRMGTCLDKFEEHEGPVRGVDFHRSQPLFVSGGDDYKVKVWDYKLRRCLFTLLGHLDYIRTVKFHHEYPWILSASDDQTIRIWNWQSRQVVSVLVGHNHYVMSALFHPRDDLIVSASLDQTVRVWDISNLRKKNVRGIPTPQIKGEDNSAMARINNEIFGPNDATVKYVLEGHERGVNWASFHPTLPLIISGADDRQVKLWRMSETKAWEVDTLRGHSNNVSCALFHPKHELIISNSEDKTIRVWDMSKRTCVQLHRKDNDRFWVLAAHPEQNILAAGHDSGFIIFKLEHERPPFDTIDKKVYYIKDRYLRLFEFTSGKDIPVVSLRRTSSNSTPGIGGGPTGLSYNIFNKSEGNILMTSDADGGTYELVTFTGESSGGEAQEVRKGQGISVVFLARDRFLVLDKSKQLLVKNFQNEVIKRLSSPVANPDGLCFCGISGRFIVKNEDSVTLYDYQAKKVIAELLVSRVRFVVWNHDYSMVALISKHQIVLANKSLEQVASVTETVQINGGSWDSKSVIFVYTTLNHVKYLITNGDKGIVRALDAPVYVTKYSTNNGLYCLDKDGKVKTIEVDLTEALFKLALEKKDYGEVVRMVKSSRLCGQGIISYLQDKGYPEVALNFVQDPKVRFKLALSCGNIQIAMQMAHELDDDNLWRELGTEALRQGNHEVVEKAYQKTKDFERLSFLYLITGNTEKLKKMLVIAERRNDVMSRYHNALLLGNAEERVKTLEITGQLALAYITAKTHGLEDDAERIAQLLSASNLPIPAVDTSKASLLQPPTPIIRSENWPLLAMAQKNFALADVHKAQPGLATKVSEQEENFYESNDGGSKWDDDADLFDDEGGDNTKPSRVADTEVKGPGWGDDDLELSDDEAPKSSGNSEPVPVGGSYFTAPLPGNPPITHWCSESPHAADHLAASSAESALQLLNRQIAASNFTNLRSNAVSLSLGSVCYLPGIPGAPSNKSYLSRNATASKGDKEKGMPSLALKATALLEKLKFAYKSFTNAQFDECKENLDSIIAGVPLCMAASKQEGNELKELLDVCREYITAIRIKLAMGNSEGGDIGRSLELAAYFTHCNLQPAHLMLALKTAMANAFKSKNFINAASFARRLLEIPEMSAERNADTRVKAQKVLQKSEQSGRNEYTIDYDEMNPFSIDCFDLKPIYKGSPSVRCPYCSSVYAPSYKGKLCVTCNISVVGTETVGLVVIGGGASRSK